jgi:hypothetical protein
MQFYIFKSEATKDLRAFAGDVAGSKLPGRLGPWTVTGVVAAERAPPHKLDRKVIEGAITEHGFQLWRMAKNAADA